jgi:hypothetical protein
VNDSKIKASADLFVQGNLTSEQMKAKLRSMKRQEEEEAKTREEVEAYFENFRTGLLILWVLSNGKLQTDLEMKSEMYVHSSCHSSHL